MITSGACRSVFTQCDFKAIRINPDFALGNDAALVLMYELDGVFDADDVPRRMFVAMPNHGCQGR